MRGLIASLVANRLQYRGPEACGAVKPEVSPDAIWTLFQQHYLDQQTPYSLEAFEISHRAGHDHLLAKLLRDNQPVGWLQKARAWLSHSLAA